MGLRYKIDILKALNEKGYTPTKIRNEKILSESTLQKFRKGEGISWDNIERLCRLLNMQPSDFLEYISDER